MPKRGTSVESSAAKRKKSGTKQPTQVVALGTEFDPTYFVSEGKFDRFATKFRHRPVVSGHPINLDKVTDYDILPLFNHQGWTKFLTLSCPWYETHVKIFYSNLTHDTRDDFVSSFLSNTRLILDFRQIFSTLDVPYDGEKVFKSDFSNFTHWPPGFDAKKAWESIHTVPFVSNASLEEHSISILKPQARIIAKIIHHTILPKGGEHYFLRGCGKLLIFLIMHKVPVHLPSLVRSFMLDDHGKRSLPYGMFLSYCLTRVCHLHLSIEIPRPPGSVFNHTNVAQMDLEEMNSATRSRLDPARIAEIKVEAKLNTEARQRGCVSGSSTADLIGPLPRPRDFASFYPTYERDLWATNARIDRWGQEITHHLTYLHQLLPPGAPKYVPLDPFSILLAPAGAGGSAVGDGGGEDNSKTGRQWAILVLLTQKDRSSRNGCRKRLDKFQSIIFFLADHYHLQ